MTKFDTTHSYALSMKIDELLRWADENAVLVHARVGDHDERRPIFCYSGMSGIGHATALASAYFNRYGSTFGMIYVRKVKETADSHGRAIETSLNTVEGYKVIFVLVDDMIASGRTQDHVLTGAFKALHDRYDNPKIDDDYIRCLMSGTDLGTVADRWRPVKKPAPASSIAVENDDAFEAFVARPASSFWSPPPPPRWTTSGLDGMKRLTLKGKAALTLDIGALQKTKELAFSG
jgi:hypothetical protein